MKRIILSLFILFSVVELFAQSDSLMKLSTNPYEFKQNLRLAKRELAREDNFATRSQIRFGTGINLACLGSSRYRWVGDTPDGVHYKSLDNGLYMPLFLEYGYRVWDFLEVVGSVFYYGTDGYEVYANGVNGAPDKLLKTIDDYNIFSIGAYARYSWYNSEYLSLYSTLGLWYFANSDYTTDAESGITTSDTFSGVIPEVMPFGMRFGKRFFGFFEPFGLSMRGYFCTIGVGARF